MNKPFRFWGTKDSDYTWEILEKIEADWIGTDQPEKLREFFEIRE